MRDRYQRRAVAAVALALAISASAGAALAQEATEDENVPLDTKIFRQLMKDWGFRREGDTAGIDYRERAPLVLPPSRALPPPQSEATGSINNPAWPVDPDVKRRKQEAAAEKAKLKGGMSAEEQSRALRPSELNVCRRTQGESPDGGNKGPAVGPTAEDSGRSLTPSELGSTNVFGSLFSSFSPNKKSETAPFTGEPPRASMTEPPSGYQTPSPSQPYGLGPAKDTYTVPKPEDAAVGTAQGK
jgi:hypothetical protein